MTSETAAPVKTVPVSEIFGPTIQGEGSLAGVPTYFLRVGGCDFGCLWCDTDQAVLPENVRKLDRLEPSIIAETLLGFASARRGPRWLTISGGNPALYDLSTVVREWRDHHDADGLHGKIAVETQGSRWHPWLGGVDVLTVSPKPPSSGMTQHYGAELGALGMPVLENFMQEYGDAWESWAISCLKSGEDPHSRYVVLKVPCFDEDDYQFARALHVRYPLIRFFLSTGTAMGGLSGKWVPPLIPDLREGEYDKFRSPRQYPGVNWSREIFKDSPATLLRRYRWLVERAMNDEAMANVAVFPQLHALIWGIDARGV